MRHLTMIWVLFLTFLLVVPTLVEAIYDHSLVDTHNYSTMDSSTSGVLNKYTSGSVVSYWGPQFNDPGGLALDNSTQNIYVTNYDSNNITIFNAQSRQVTGYIKNFSLPTWISYDPFDQYLIVDTTKDPNYVQNVTIYDIEKDSVVHVFINTSLVISDPDNGNLYSLQGSNITVYSSSTFLPINVIEFGQRISTICFDQYMQSILVGLYNDSVAIVNCTSYDINKYVQLRDTTDNIVLQPTAIGTDPRNSFIFAKIGYYCLEKVDLASGNVIWSENYSGVNMLGKETNLVFDPVNNLIFSTDTSGSIVAYSGLNGKEFNDYLMNAGSYSVVYNPSDHNIYAITGGYGFPLEGGGIAVISEKYTANEQVVLFTLFKAALVIVLIASTVMYYQYFRKSQHK